MAESLTTISELLELTPQRIRQLVKKGVIPDGVKGKYDVVLVVQGYLRYLRDMVGGKDDSKAKHEKDKLKEEARLKALAVQRLEGSLVDAEGVAKGAFEQGRKIRDSIMNLPDRLSPLLVAEDDTNKIHKMLSEEIRSILEGAKGA